MAERGAHLACQVLHQEPLGDSGLLVDLITLERTELDEGELVAGAPITLAFDAQAMPEARPRFAKAMGLWAETGAVIDIEVRARHDGLTYVFTGLTEQVVLEVELPPGTGGGWLSS